MIESGRSTRFLPAFYPPREDTFLLLPFARPPRRSTLLEIGTGSGLLALEAGRAGARVVATDRNPHALKRVRTLALAEELEVAVVRTDLASGLGRFDRVLANPPYLPTTSGERDPDRWHDLALDGGPDGLRVTERLVARVGDHLTASASAFLVTSSVQDPEGLRRIREDWGRHGRVEVVAERLLEGEERLEVWRLSLEPGTRRLDEGVRSAYESTASRKR